MTMPGVGSATRRAAAGVLIALVITSCGSSEEVSPLRPHEDSGVADERFDGLFNVTDLQVEGRPEPPVEPIVFEIDAEFGDLSIDTACGTLLGSFTFFDDGGAGITIAGRVQRPSCSGEAEAQTGRLLEILNRVDGWRADASSLDLFSADGDQITLLG
ncbi:MAG: META domain-containing protein [Actinomycetia bacterium]|nr:META domain-containing protein [Actinomycetes bacterium]